jgi:hypothetical protein
VRPLQFEFKALGRFDRGGTTDVPFGRSPFRFELYNTSETHHSIFMSGIRGTGHEPLVQKDSHPRTDHDGLFAIVGFSSVHCSDYGRPLFKTKVAFCEFERVTVLYIVSTLLRSAAQSTLRIQTEPSFSRFLFLESLSRKKASGSALICYKLNGALSGRGLFRSFCRLSRSICS